MKKVKKTDGPRKVYEDQNHSKAIATGFHGDSSEQEVEQLLKETITGIGVSTESALAKLITQDFTYVKDNDGRNKCVRSANMLRKEKRGRKVKISRSMDAGERFHHKRLGTSNVAFTRDVAFLSTRFH